LRGRRGKKEEVKEEEGRGEGGEGGMKREKEKRERRGERYEGGQSQRVSQSASQPVSL